MNRHARRAEAAKARADQVRHSAVHEALAYMASANDPTITGATLILPDGRRLYLPADTARSMACEPRSKAAAQG